MASGHCGCWPRSGAARGRRLYSRAAGLDMCFRSSGRSVWPRRLTWKTWQLAPPPQRRIAVLRALRPARPTSSASTTTARLGRTYHAIALPPAAAPNPTQIDPCNPTSAMSPDPITDESAARPSMPRNHDRMDQPQSEGPATLDLVTIRSRTTPGPLGQDRRPGWPDIRERKNTLS